MDAVIWLTRDQTPGPWPRAGRDRYAASAVVAAGAADDHARVSRPSSARHAADSIDGTRQAS